MFDKASMKLGLDKAVLQSMGSSKEKATPVHTDMFQIGDIFNFQESPLSATVQEGDRGAAAQRGLRRADGLGEQGGRRVLRGGH